MRDMIVIVLLSFSCGAFLFSSYTVADVLLLSFVGGGILQRLLIELQHRLHLSQAQKSYGVGIDTEIKAATPTMGGVVFIITAIAVMILQGTANNVLFWSLPIACGLIGFADDWLKVTRKSSEGFTSLRKLAAQLIVAAVWLGIFGWHTRAGSFLYWAALPVLVLVTVGMMNAVNVTDGLDGLAGGAFLISLYILAALWIPMSIGGTYTYSSGYEFIALLGMAAVFMLYNVRPARIFMGDTGSHFLGGALVAMCVCHGSIWALIPCGFLFWVELLSSAIQIFSIRVFGKKIFRMAPLHHHFQLKGWGETEITVKFLFAHFLGIILTSFLMVYILYVMGMEDLL